TPAIITVTSDGDTIALDNKVTLREAIESANNNANVNADVVAVGAYGNDEIWFNIGAGPHIIVPTDTFTIRDPRTILGYTHPGAQPNTLDVGNNAVLNIVLDGNQGQFPAISIKTGNTTIQGLKITNFKGNGIELPAGVGRTNNTIQGNYITDNKT